MAEIALSIPELVRQSFTNARGAARQVIDLQLPLGVLVQAMVVVVIANVMLEQLIGFGSGGLPEPPEDTDMSTRVGYQLVVTFFNNPLYWAAVQGAFLAMSVFAIHFVGRALDGRGQLEDAMSVMIWFQVLLIMMQVLQFLTSVIMEPLTVFVGFATLILFFYWLTQFIMEVHGFQSAAAVLTMIIVTAIGMLIVLSLILALLGVTIIGPLPDV
ncbi:MAG: YIP1 family protein [Pseudomonadota bacterium]